MIKKQFIIILAILFFVSTTGLPLSMHLCKMAGTFTIEECDMCIEEKQPFKISCCEELNEEYKIVFKSDLNFGCCETTLIDASVKDKFISAKIDKKEETFSKIYLPQLNFSILHYSYHTFYFYTDTSPPHLISNALYLSNSIFLI